jgi:hypothetical protein
MNNYQKKILLKNFENDLERLKYRITTFNSFIKAISSQEIENSLDNLESLNQIVNMDLKRILETLENIKNIIEGF